ncbi:MAG: hypothetical protein WCC27_16415, partial [Acidobacteriaceae bacterium]
FLPALLFLVRLLLALLFLAQPRAVAQSTMAAGTAAGIRPEGESGGHRAWYPEPASPAPDTSLPTRMPKRQEPLGRAIVKGV